MTDTEPEAGELERLRAELAVVRKLVDEAITTCELGSAIAAHYGRDIP